MNNTLLKQQEPIFIITKWQYPYTKAQTSDRIQQLENYGNSTVVSNDIVLSKQEPKIDLFFTIRRQNIIDIYYIPQSYFNLPKNTIRKNSNIIILFEQNLGDIILLFHNVAGFDMNLE